MVKTDNKEILRWPNCWLHLTLITLWFLKCTHENINLTYFMLLSQKRIFRYWKQQTHALYFTLWYDPRYNMTLWPKSQHKTINN